MSVKKEVKPSAERANPFNLGKNKKYLTESVFLLGNGSSRKDFDLERLRPYGTILGCNAIFRDFIPDILLAIDAKMLREIKDAKCTSEDNMCIIPKSRGVAVPYTYKWQAEKFNTSGCFGMHVIGKLMEAKYCYMLGMDCFAGNIYVGTPNYSVNMQQNFGGIGQYYIKALKANPDTKFINVNIKDSWAAEAHILGNYMYITYKEFEEILQYETTD